jgi:Arc/MetJ-type ribon-helix-helix transcriptional regulator
MDFVESYIRRGYAASKAEVLRAGLAALKGKTQPEDEERRGYLLLAEKSLKKIWDTPEEEAFWSKYY